MGCCFSSSGGDDERQPLIQTESARPPRSKAIVQKAGPFIARNVGVPDLDERFGDVAETFNKQQEHYEVMKNTLKTLTDQYKCPTKDSLSQCLKLIQDEHELYNISLEVKGYDFTLKVRSDAEIPSKLKMTQECITELSKAAKCVISVGTKLQEMIDWLLKDQLAMIEQVEASEFKHQDKKRLLENLKKNLQEAERAKELSPQYRKEAGALLNEAALLSGITP